jgi:hypothetical protein
MTLPQSPNLLYYKERTQLKTFRTQIGPALPLTPDPPVICFWKWIGRKDYKVPKNCNLESVSTKNNFFHPWLVYPPTYTYTHRANTPPCDGVYEKNTPHWATHRCLSSRETDGPVPFSKVDEACRAPLYSLSSGTDDASGSP